MPHGPAALLLDDVGLGVVTLTAQGAIDTASAPARALLSGEGGEALQALLVELAAGASTRHQALMETTLDLEWGEVRVVLAPADDGFVAALERRVDRALARHARALREMVGAAAGARGADAALQAALCALCAALPGLEAALYVRGGPGPASCAARGGAAHATPGVSPEALVARALASGRPAHQVVRPPGAKRPFTALALPVRWQGELVGALHAAGTHLAEGELRAVQGLADLAGALLGRARLEEALAAERAGRAEALAALGALAERLDAGDGAAAGRRELERALAALRGLGGGVIHSG